MKNLISYFLKILFPRCSSTENVKDLINEVFSNFGSDFIFLEAQKNNSIKVSDKQDLNGQGIFDLARYGSLYLKEEVPTALKPGEAVNSTEGPVDPSTASKPVEAMNSTEGPVEPLASSVPLPNDPDVEIVSETVLANTLEVSMNLVQY